jgi:elongation factor 3
MNYSSSLNQLESMAIVKNLTSKNSVEQQEGITLVQKMLSQYEPINEPFLISLISLVLDLGSEKKLQIEIELVCNELIKKINPYAFELVFGEISKVFTGVKFQSKIQGLRMISNYAKSFPLIVSSNLPIIIDSLINLNSDIKKEVKQAIRECWIAICETITNVDMKPIISVMIEGYINPSTKTEQALETMASQALVNDVDIPTLAFLIPMLVRAMREKKVVLQRKAAVVMDTLCKLIKNPVYARIFYDKLNWILEKGINEISIEEVRNVCSRSKNTLDRVYEQSNTKLIDSITKTSCLELYHKEINTRYKLILEPNNSLISYTINLILGLVRYEIRDTQAYWMCMEQYLAHFLTHKETRYEIVESITKQLIDTISVYEHDPEEGEENLCDCMFSLAYGTRVLLHQTPLKLKVGRTYGILGSNGTGKSTLMRSMVNHTLQNFPFIPTAYFEHHIPEDKMEMITLDYLLTDPMIKEQNISKEVIIDGLRELNLTDNMINSPLNTLSGGNCARVMLLKVKLSGAKLILLDEPTNHVDATTNIWLRNYISNAKDLTFLIISHDIKFLDEVCTNVIHYENLKLKVYKGNISEFVKQKPEAAFYFETSSQDILSFNFPDPGQLEGVKSLTKAVLKMKDCSFQYKTSDRPQLRGVNIQVSMASRVVICGVNGAGKTTLVKLLVGEIEPNQGLIERHPNLRMAYVPQNVTSALEGHYDKTPVEYIMWRYRLGFDREQKDKSTITLTDDEIEAIKEKARLNKTFVIKELKSRRTGKREHEYEAVGEGIVELTQWFSKSELIEMGYEKMINEIDQRIAMESMMGQKKLTTGEIQKHMDGFGLEPEIAQHTKIGSLSSGQKHKVILSAIFWQNPHIAIFDEPTNFLDKESTSALSDAIKNFKGGILVISHNEDFYNALTREKWLLEGGTMVVFEDNLIEALEKERKKKEKDDAKKLKFGEDEDKFDSLGNKIIIVKEEKKELTRDDKKLLLKQKKELQKAGEDTYEIDVLLGLA